MKEEKKLTLIITLLVLAIVLVSGGTLAYFQWATSTEQDTLVNVSLTDDAKMYIDFPSEEITHMYPTSDCDSNGTSSWVTEITVDNGTGVLLSPNFKLKVKIEDKNGNIITNVTNTGNSNPNRYYIKYAVTGENESCNNALYTGRFGEETQTVNGNNTWFDSELITLYDEDTNFPIVSGKIGSGVSFYAQPNTQTKQRYRVYVWLDKDYVSVTQGTTSSDTMQDAKVTVSWSENSGLEQVKKTKTGTAYAVYSSDDNSLRFYRSTTPITQGSQYNGRIVTSVYTGFEDVTYSSYKEVLWYENASGIFQVIFEDYIYPTNTAWWFAGLDLCAFYDVTKLDVSNVTSTSRMFLLNKPTDDHKVTFVGLETWDTSKVTDMSSMFNKMEKYTTLDLSSWNVCNVVEYSSFSSGTYITEPYFGRSLLCDGKTTSKAYAVYSLDDDSLRFYRSETPITEGEYYNGKIASLVFTNIENTQIAQPPWYYIEYQNGDMMYDGTLCDGDFGTCDVYLSYEKIVFEDYVYPLNTISWFLSYECDYVDVTKLDVSNVIRMDSMFQDSYITSLIGLETWDTSDVKIMFNMFLSASIGNEIDLSGWNVCNVIDNQNFSKSFTGTMIEPNFGMACP